jgi:hypothetical protein
MRRVVDLVVVTADAADVVIALVLPQSNKAVQTEKIENSTTLWLSDLTIGTAVVCGNKNIIDRRAYNYKSVLASM